MKQIQAISREESIFTHRKNLQELYTLKNFPIFMGCVETKYEEDIFFDMEWKICPETGVIQLGRLLPLELLYLNQHNEGCGSIWMDHYDQFVTFLTKFQPHHILEIGGAHGIIAEKYLAKVPNTEWTIVEPNPTIESTEQIKVIKAWFDDTFTFDKSADAIVHSHVLEHTYDPVSYLTSISSFLTEGDKHIFSFPNMVEQLRRKYTNCLNFEHTVFLSEYFVDYLLQKCGFKILEKYYYKDHSIFYATERIKQPNTTTVVLENKYLEYKDLFMEFVQYHLDMIKELNGKIAQTTMPIYLFGAHIFSQYLIGFGLETTKIKNILDNGPAKQGKRLYGTKLMVVSPKVLKDIGKAAVILKAGIYNEEIKKDILEHINSEIIFW
jgi:hypothetical protein